MCTSVTQYMYDCVCLKEVQIIMCVYVELYPQWKLNSNVLNPIVAVKKVDCDSKIIDQGHPFILFLNPVKLNVVAFCIAIKVAIKSLI